MTRPLHYLSPNPSPFWRGGQKRRLTRLLVVAALLAVVPIARAAQTGNLKLDVLGDEGAGAKNPAHVIAPNGKPFTEQSIGMTLAVRNLMTDLRSSGEVTGGPKSFAARDRSTFLAALDQTIRRIQRRRADAPAPSQG